MEKFIFLAEVKDRLTELKLPQESISKHLKIFEDCFVGKSAEEIDKIIEGTGGVDGIVKSIYNLETAKKTISSTDNNQSDAEKTGVPAEETTNEAPVSIEEPSNVIAPQEEDVPAFEILAKIPDETKKEDSTDQPTSEFSAVTKETPPSFDPLLSIEVTENNDSP